VNLWLLAIVGLLLGLLPGLAMMPLFASPLFPMGLWVLSDPFARIQLTISQVIRRDGGVLVKRAAGRYEIGTYLPESDEVLLEDTRIKIDASKLNWGLFGKRRFAATWEEGTDVHEQIRVDDDSADDEIKVNMGALHRMFQGSNNADVISRTEEQAEAEYGGGDQGISETAMAVLVAVMLVLGALTTGLMI
jgi:hypothetical protein